MPEEIRNTQEIPQEGKQKPGIPENGQNPEIPNKEQKPGMSDEMEESNQSILEATEEKLRSGVQDMRKSMEGLEQRLRKRKSEADVGDGENDEAGRRGSLEVNEAKIQKAVENMDAAVEPSLIEKIENTIVHKVGTAAEYIKRKLGSETKD